MSLKINAEKAREDSVYYKQQRKIEREKFNKMEVEKRVFAKIRNNVLEGDFMAYFNSRDEEGRYIRKNSDMFKELGYELSFFMGTSAIQDVRIEWRGRLGQ